MKGLRKALLIGMTLGVTMLGTIGCMNQDSASSNDVLKVGAISFAGTLEPTENYFRERLIECKVLLVPQ